MSTDKSNEWSGGEYFDLGPSGAIAAADYAINRFRDLGITIPAGNRLIRAQRLLQRLNDRSITLVQHDRDLVRTITEAQWTTLNFYLIAKATAGTVTEEHRSKIEMALGGADLPEQDKNHLPRNTEFELVVAATLAMGGLRVGLGEPDVNVVLADELVGVAAKRVQGPTSIRKRMKEAASQIETSGMPGLIAINADVIMIGTAPVGDALAKGQTVDEQIIEVHKADDELVMNTNVLGRIAFARAAIWDFSGDHPVLTQDMYRQYRVYERRPGEGETLISELNAAEALITKRMHNL